MFPEMEPFSCNIKKKLKLRVFFIFSYISGSNLPPEQKKIFILEETETLKSSQSAGKCTF